MTQFSGDLTHYLKDLRTDTGTLRPGRQGQVLNFDGVDDYAETTPHPLTAETGSYSVAAWVTLDTGNSFPMIFSGDTAQLEVRFSGSTRIPQVTTHNPSLTATSPTALALGEEHHIVATWDSGDGYLRLYVDGALVATSSTSNLTRSQMGSKLQIGARGTAFFFGGKIRDACMYSAALSPGQVSDMYSGTRITANLVAGWYGADESGTKLYDWSGNGNHLDLVNTTESTFRETDATVVNPVNEEGYSQTAVVELSDRRLLAIPANDLQGKTNSVISCRVKIDSNQRGIIFGTNSASQWLGSYQAGITGIQICTDPTMITRVDGVEITNTRDALDTAINDNTEHLLEFEGDFTAGDWIVNGLFVNGYVSGWDISGQVWDVRLDGVQYPVGEIIPAVDATTDALGNTLQYQGKCVFPQRVDTPCITGDGTATYVDMGSALIPATADFTVNCWYYPDTGFKGIWQVGNFNTAGKLHISQNGTTCTLGLPEGSGALDISIADALPENEWTQITVSRVGNTFTLTAGNKSATVTDATAISQLNTRLLQVFDYESGGRIADFKITTGGVTKTFALQEGGGRDVWWTASDGTYGKIANAITGGTLADIWANRCPGLVKDWSIENGGNTQRNVMRDSEDISTTRWNFSNVGTTRTTNVIANPVDGAVTADLVEENSDTDSHRIWYYDNQTSTGNVISGETYTFSVYLKDSGSGVIRINNDFASTIDLIAGTATAGQVEDVGNGWWRYSQTAIATDAILNSVFYTSENAGIFEGSPGVGFYIYGSQLELGTEATAYQATDSTYPVRGVFIPGVPGDTVDAAGNTKTLAANKFGNPHSIINTNPFDVQEISAINGETAYVAGTDRHLVAPASTKWAQTEADGTDRMFSNDPALAGADKTNAETYVNAPAIPANVITIGGSTPITIDNTEYVTVGS